MKPAKELERLRNYFRENGQTLLCGQIRTLCLPTVCNFRAQLVNVEFEFTDSMSYLLSLLKGVQFAYFGTKGHISSMTSITYSIVSLTIKSSLEIGIISFQKEGQHANYSSG